MEHPISMILLSETPVISNKQITMPNGYVQGSTNYHNCHHSEGKNDDTPRTIGTVRNLGPSECKQWWLLCTSSVLLFLLACYIHDICMFPFTVPYSELPGIWNNLLLSIFRYGVLHCIQREFLKLFSTYHTTVSLLWDLMWA